MEFLNTIIQSHGGELVSNLVNSKRFNLEQAEQFLPAAGQSILKVIGEQSKQINGDQLNSPENQQMILEKINLNALAEKVNIAPEQAQGGIQSILPQILELISGKFGNIEALLPLLGSGDMLEKAGGLLGGLTKGNLAGAGKLFG